MKQLPVAGKAITVLFTAVFLVACSGSDTKQQEQADAEAEAARAEQLRIEQMEQAEMAAEKQAAEEAVASYGNVFYFDFDSSALKPESREALDAHIVLLKLDDRSVRLEGHTDERGTREYNMALGERRANAVRDYLVVNGIASYRIETVSYGEERPVAYGSGDSNWAQNRRVELK